MSLRSRLRRLAERLGPPPAAPVELSPEERLKRLEWWISGQTYNRGVFDADPEFREAWGHYHRLWEIHTGGYSPLAAVWIQRQQPEFEDARRRVVAIMVRVLREQPHPLSVLANVFELALTAPSVP